MHNLDDESLALRKVEKLDIASTASDYWSYMIAGGSLTDLSSFRPTKTERGPLLSDWQVCFHHPQKTLFLAFHGTNRTQLGLIFGVSLPFVYD